MLVNTKAGAFDLQSAGGRAQLSELLIDGLIDWLTDRLIDWSINCLTAWLTDWLIDWLVYWLIDSWIDWLTDWVTDWRAVMQSAFVMTNARLSWIDWLIDWSTDWLIDKLIDCLIDWLIDWLAGLLIDWLMDWLIDWLRDRLTNYHAKHVCHDKRACAMANAPRSSNWLIAWLIAWLIDWLIDWLVYWLINSRIHWLTDWVWFLVIAFWMSYFHCKTRFWSSSEKENQFYCKSELRRVQLSWWQAAQKNAQHVEMTILVILTCRAFFCAACHHGSCTRLNSLLW